MTLSIRAERDMARNRAASNGIIADREMARAEKAERTLAEAMADIARLKRIIASVSEVIRGS